MGPPKFVEDHVLIVVPESTNCYFNHFSVKNLMTPVQATFLKPPIF